MIVALAIISRHVTDVLSERDLTIIYPTVVEDGDKVCADAWITCISWDDVKNDEIVFQSNFWYDWCSYKPGKTQKAKAHQFLIITLVSRFYQSIGACALDNILFQINFQYVLDTLINLL